LLGGRLAQSADHALEALELCSAIDNLEGACFSAGVVAYALSALGQLGRAYASLREVLAQIEQANFSMPMSTSTYGSLALLYVKTGMFDAARELSSGLMQRTPIEGLPIAMQAQALVEMSRIEVMLGEAGPATHMLLGFASGFEALSRGTDILLYSGSLQIRYALLRGALDEALELSVATLAALERTGARLEIPDVLLMRGQALMRLGRIDEARAALRDALGKTYENDYRLIRWRILATLEELEAQHGDPENAARCRREGRELLDQLAASLPDDPDIRAAFLAQPEAASLISK
jgi:tetratricopeptide (TPR) repeat protein